MPLQPKHTCEQWLLDARSALNKTENLMRRGIGKWNNSMEWQGELIRHPGHSWRRCPFFTTHRTITNSCGAWTQKRCIEKKRVVCTRLLS